MMGSIESTIHIYGFRFVCATNMCHEMNKLLKIALLLNLASECGEYLWNLLLYNSLNLKNVYYEISHKD